jgi:hypothetical protein
MTSRASANGKGLAVRGRGRRLFRSASWKHSKRREKNPIALH